MFSFIYNQEYAKEKENTTLNSELPLLHTQPSPQLADHSSNEMRVRQLPSPAVGPLQGGVALDRRLGRLDARGRKLVALVGGLQRVRAGRAAPSA